MPLLNFWLLLMGGNETRLKVLTVTFKEQRNGKRDRIMYHHVAASHRNVTFVLGFVVVIV